MELADSRLSLSFTNFPVQPGGIDLSFFRCALFYKPITNN
jgi:hypothetical protein